ncbi:hypothetical protein JI721_12195 [Alicyclobacillus cycloheptanicus]|uniref:Uncharacterized protein n=1 Tax=Alicyclobacillus cycloheptanicus TaxID=1457 RepID=A0ABT9XF12_9BACL|nr:hypothetical protein [Alicyclobacillus cycloheptanicus]MDQ0188886.1 hypothetical protein [Alicyclobacillus cycloheptanicus]WDM00475.1 hypothetical protein JI721_12195 [Alicyclobacillus cycloheptanicus]
MERNMDSEMFKDTITFTMDEQILENLRSAKTNESRRKQNRASRITALAAAAGIVVAAGILALSHASTKPAGPVTKVSTASNRTSKSSTTSGGLICSPYQGCDGAKSAVQQHLKFAATFPEIPQGYIAEYHTEESGESLSVDMASAGDLASVQEWPPTTGPGNGNWPPVPMEQRYMKTVTRDSFADFHQLIYGIISPT